MIPLPLALFLTFSWLLGKSAPPAAENWHSVKADFTAIAAALKTYRKIGGSYPSTEQGLEALVERPKDVHRPKRWVQLFRKEPFDPWGRKYQYRLVEGQYRLWSKGQDPKDAADDRLYVPPKK